MKSDNITYRLYTITDLSDWLLNNLSNGLSDYVIARSRAWALLNNPCARPDDVVLSVVFDGERSIGYTAVFPEQLQTSNLGESEIYWGTTQWIEPEYRGKGISGKMMRNIKDAVNNKYWGLASSISSIKLDQKQGSNVLYYPRYFFQWKTKSSKFFAKCKEWYIGLKNKKLIQELESIAFVNRYIPVIDGDTYTFISQHSNSDLITRNCEMLNWILHFPFKNEVIEDKHLEPEMCAFGTNVNMFTIKAVQVYVDNELSGVYIYSIVDNVYKLLYIYCLEEKKNNVFASIVSSALRTKSYRFQTFNKELFEFMNTFGIKNMNSTFNTEQISLTFPPNIEIDTNLSIQGGDGDMFC